MSARALARFVLWQEAVKESFEAASDTSRAHAAGPSPDMRSVHLHLAVHAHQGVSSRGMRSASSRLALTGCAGAKPRHGGRCVTPGVRPRGEPPGVTYTHLLKKGGGRGRERSTRLCRGPRFSLAVARPCLSLPLTHIDCVADSRQGSASLRWLSCALHASAVFGEHPPVSLPWARIGCVTRARLSLPLSHIDCVADSRQGLASLGWLSCAFHVSAV